MAMAKVCTQAIVKLTSNHYDVLLQRSPFHSGALSRRPIAISAVFSRDKPLSSPSSTTLAFSSAVKKDSLFRTVIISSQRFPVENCAKISALSDNASKASWDSGGRDGGAGGDGRGDGGSGGDNSSGRSKGDDTPPKSLISWYLLLLNNHPVTTKAITSALLNLFGDLVCQLMIEKSETVDLKRIGIFTLLGLVLVGPTLHFWYLTLSKLVPGPGIAKTGVRLVLDQFLFSPIFIGAFFSALLTLEGHTSSIVPKLRQDWPSAVVANWKIWIPFQFLNFLLVPQQLQVLAANVISLGWNTYLSFATHK